MTEPKSLKELLQDIIEHTDAHNDRSEWRPEAAKLAQQALDAAGEFELLRSRNEYLEAQFQHFRELEAALRPQPKEANAAKGRAVEAFVDTIIGAFESGFLESNTLSLATIYQVMREHCKSEFGVSVAPLVAAWGETTARECNAAPAAVPKGWDAEVDRGRLRIQSPEGRIIQWKPHPSGSSYQDICGRLIIKILSETPAAQQEPTQ